LTAQIPDRLRYAGRDFLIIGGRGDGLFDPARFDLKVQAFSTACYRGFHCKYLVDAERRLLLQEVYLGLDEDAAPRSDVKLFGRTPQTYVRHGQKLTAEGLVDHTWTPGDCRLTELAEPMEFNGELLIGTGYLEGVRDLTFERGRLVGELDGEAVVDRIFQRSKGTASPLISASDIALWTAKLEAFGHRPLAAANMRNALRARETCALEVMAGDGLDLGLTAFKIYVNGNIRGPRPGLQGKSWDKQQILPFEPGAYRIVLRGKDVGDPHRLESNTLHFDIATGERRRVVANMRGEALVIEMNSADRT
jgi:hypothetical protein